MKELIQDLNNINFSYLLVLYSQESKQEAL